MPPPTAADATALVWVEGMQYRDCDDIGLELLLGAVPGVADAEVDFDSGRTLVRFDPAATSRARILEEIAQRGFRVAAVTDAFVVSGWQDPRRDAPAVQLLLQSLDGVQAVQVGPSGRTLVRYDPARVTPETLVAEIANLGWTLAPAPLEPISGAGIEQAERQRPEAVR